MQNPKEGRGTWGWRTHLTGEWGVGSGDGVGPPPPAGLHMLQMPPPHACTAGSWRLASTPCRQHLTLLGRLVMPGARLSLGGGV